MTTNTATILRLKQGEGNINENMIRDISVYIDFKHQYSSSVCYCMYSIYGCMYYVANKGNSPCQGSDDKLLKKLGKIFIRRKKIRKGSDACKVIYEEEFPNI